MTPPGADGLTETLPGFAALAARYRGVILDLWGVVHDGVAPFPGVLDCLERLRHQDVRVLLLSNAPRRAAATQAALRAMGIGDALYHGIITSGEATHLALKHRHAPGADPWFTCLGRRMLHLGPDRDRNVFTGLDLVEAAGPETADWILNTGPDDLSDAHSLTPFQPLLDACLALRLPMLCANPDLEVVRDGARILCAGSLAELYRSQGGMVRSLGKPDPAIYQPVLAQLELPAAQVIAVGDSLRTDIAGAQAAGIDSCWVLSGIHEHESDPAMAQIRAGQHPVARIPRFVW